MNTTKPKIKPNSQTYSKTRNLVVSEAIIRPTGLLDPEIILRPTTNQVDDILEEVRQRKQKNQRVLITTLTKKFAEELDSYFKQLSLKSAYLHSDIDTLERVSILSDLRSGVYDVLIGINLLREGLDLPEVSLVGIFDADKEGFLRSRSSLIQIIGRAARHQEGKVIMYADKLTKAMKEAIEETETRRQIQERYNFENQIIPKSTLRENDNLKTRLQDNINNNPNFGEAGVIFSPQGLTIKAKKISAKNRPENSNFNYETENFSLDQISSISSRFDRKNKNNQGLSFKDKKLVYLGQIKSLNLDQEELLERQKQAIKKNNFEEADAIQEILDSISKSLNQNSIF